VNDDGVVSVLMLALLALAGLLCLATADAANVLLTRARAQAAADAAALAAAAAQWDAYDDPNEAARRIAEANGAVLDRCDCPAHGEEAIVRVSRRTYVRMLGVAPSRVNADAEATFDAGRIFEPR
jgi:secretion/DNA translocation related TadE-like protein